MIPPLTPHPWKNSQDCQLERNVLGLLSVDGGHRAIIFSRIGGVQEEVYVEGLHFRWDCYFFVVVVFRLDCLLFKSVHTF